jgi:DNA-binding PadR family transcriptional regulator
MFTRFYATHHEDRRHRFEGRGWPGQQGHGRCEHAHPEGDSRGFRHGFGGHGAPEHGHRRGFGGRGRGGPERGFARGFGEGRARLFDAGDVKLVILKLLSEQPSYGYQLIKTMEQRLSGGYVPSAGVIYPTLTMLEEEGLATSAAENNKKVFSLTEEGRAYLEANQATVTELFARLEEAGKSFERGRSPEIMKAFMNLRSAVMARVSRESVKPEQIQKITEAINAAAKSIDEL